MGNTLVADDSRLLTKSLGILPDPELEPVFVIVSGLPGTGKSYFSRKLAERLPSLILESDALRKVLFLTPEYTAQESSRLFRAIYQLIEELLKKGMPIILDATNLSEQYRERLYSIAERLEVRLVLVSVNAPPELVRERLQSRTGEKDRQDSSDADWSVYQRMKDSVQKMKRRYYAVDTSRDIAPVIAKIVREARK